MALELLINESQLKKEHLIPIIGIYPYFVKTRNMGNLAEETNSNLSECYQYMRQRLLLLTMYNVAIVGLIHYLTQNHS